ncbi:putative uncharacterized protein DDB_G0282133 [Episyrphus balteatus]|uniref:putative uncharacterized protein DDB_G0282133 n=1 Tax=Episyrphus balteatus TaxID=286459 RepID=UPI002485F6ED|nr:putative uncharacterized protein DDB_G0282133 [Episyrphus balteatus]
MSNTGNLDENILEENNEIAKHIEDLRERSSQISDILGNFFSERTDNNKEKMLTLNIDPLKYISKLPDFNGDYRELQNFIDLVDKIHPVLVKYDQLSQSIFSDYLKSKVKGKAREVLEINSHITSWPDIKATLISNFGDRLTLEELFDELRSVQFKTNSVDFFNEIKTTLRRLNIKTKLIFEKEDHTIIETNIENNKHSALVIFRNKIPEPMRSLICCRNPQSLESAITILHECGYAHYNPYNKSLTPKLNTQQHKDTDTAIQKKRPMNPNTSWQPRSFNHQYMNPSFESYRPNNFNTSWQPRTTNNNYIKPPFDHYRSNNTSYNANRQPNNNNYIKPPFEHNRPHPNNYNNTQHYNSNNQNQNPFRNSNNSNNRNTQEPMEIGLAQRRQDTNQKNQNYNIEPSNFHLLASDTTYPI